MRHHSYLFSLVFVFCGFVNLFGQQVPIGQWRDELPYTLCNAVVDAVDKVYCSTPYAVFYINKEDNSIVRITKINGLSDIGISSMNYSKENNTLIIAYSNANIDLIKNNSIINISDIKRKPILGNKTINSIYFIGKNAYLCCGFGIVVLDVVKEEIRDTYYIGKDGSQVNVFGLVMDNKDSLFAATEKGVYKANFKNPNLANFTSWRKDTHLDTSSTYNTITYFSERVIVNKKSTGVSADTMYYYSNNSWTKWLPEFFLPVMKLESSEKYLFVCYNNYVVGYNPELSRVINVYNYNPGTPFPLDAIIDDTDVLWIADTYSGLIAHDLKTGSFQPVNISGPLTAKAFSLTCKGNDLYIAPGGRDASYVPLWTSAQIYRFDNSNWTNISGSSNPPLYNYFDLVTVSVDPNNNNHYYSGSWNYGLLEFYNDTLFQVYNKSNSTLKPHSADTNVIRVGGTMFDNEGNLWVVTSHTNSCLSMKKGNKWTGFTITEVNDNDLGQLVIDHYNQKWIVMRYSNLNPNSLLVFTDNGTPDNPNDDRSKTLNTSVGNGNIPGNIVFSIAVDKDGEVWVGTEKGIGVFYSPENIFTGQNFDAQRILVEQDGYIQYLLENETATAIAIDGANRKWIGTDRGGVFLFSDDGTKQIYHFTEENSPLLSNRITSIAINQDGEVFFATDKGVVSFRSTATPGGDTNENVYAFPNPVRAEYDGYIAIKGLVSNAQVRITDITGTLVYSTKAEGGQAIWDGKNFDGKKAKSGVYLVFAANENGSEKIVTKILIIN